MNKEILSKNKKKILLIWPSDGYDGATLPLCYIYFDSNAKEKIMT